jgi:DNA-binding transcriptional LysR family regulator
MKRLNLEFLNTFVTVVEAGSLSAAAPRLFRSQAAVSEQVRKLEETVGVPLLSRGKTGAAPTPAGERLFNHARKLLDLSEAAVRDVKGSQLEGELRLAVTEYFRPSAVTSILKRIQRTYPNLRLHVSVEKSIEIEGALQRNEFDIGIPMCITNSRPPPRRRAVPSIKLAREPLRWVAAEAVDLADAGPLPLILLPETCSLHRLVLRQLRRRKIDFYIAHTASGVAGAQQALLAGLGITCLNESAVPANAQILKPCRQLPKMPDVEFALLPSRDSGSSLVSRVRAILVEEFTTYS